MMNMKNSRKKSRLDWITYQIFLRPGHFTRRADDPNMTSLLVVGAHHIVDVAHSLHRGAAFVAELLNVLPADLNVGNVVPIRHRRNRFFCELHLVHWTINLCRFPIEKVNTA